MPNHPLLLPFLVIRYPWVWDDAATRVILVNLRVGHPLPVHRDRLEHVLHDLVLLCLQSRLHSVHYIIVRLLLLLFSSLEFLESLIPTTQSKTELALLIMNRWSQYWRDEESMRFLRFAFGWRLACTSESRWKLFADLGLDFAPSLAHFFLLLDLVDCGHVALRYLVVVLHAVLETLGRIFVKVLGRGLLELVSLLRIYANTPMWLIGWV